MTVNNFLEFCVRIRNCPIFKKQYRIKFNNLMHHIYNVERLRKCFFEIKKKTAAGIDEVTWKDYEENLERNLQCTQDLSQRLKTGGYRAKPVRKNRIVLAHHREELVGYIDYRDDWNDPKDLYLSSIQIKKAFQGGYLFRLLISRLIDDLRGRDLRIIKTNIQRSNLRMIAIARKMGFAIEQNVKSPATFNLSADKTILNSSRVVRLLLSR